MTETVQKKGQRILWSLSRRPERQSSFLTSSAIILMPSFELFDRHEGEAQAKSVLLGLVQIEGLAPVDQDATLTQAVAQKRRIESLWSR